MSQHINPRCNLQGIHLINPLICQLTSLHINPSHILLVYQVLSPLDNHHHLRLIQPTNPPDNLLNYPPSILLHNPQHFQLSNRLFNRQSIPRHNQRTSLRGSLQIFQLLILLHNLRRDPLLVNQPDLQVPNLRHVENSIYPLIAPLQHRLTIWTTPEMPHISIMFNPKQPMPQFPTASHSVRSITKD